MGTPLNSVCMECSVSNTSKTTQKRILKQYVEQVRIKVMDKHK